MTIKLSGTEGISSTDGTASNPSIKSISYGNTSGVFFPSTNTVGIATSSVRAITVAADQKVGIGTSSPAYTLDVSGNARVTGDIIPSSQFSNRNRLINGDMRINQRAASYTITTGNQYTIDRWLAATGPNALGAVVNVTRAPTLTPGGPAYALRLAHTSGTLSSGVVAVYQVIETINCIDLASTAATTRQVTLSYKLRKGSGYTGVTVTPYLITGTGSDEGNAGGTNGTWTGRQSQNAIVTQVVGTTLTTDLARAYVSALSTSLFQTYTATFTVPIGTAEMMIYFLFDGMSAVGSATNYIDITDIQLEPGSNATPFERLPFQMQVQACQRYYSKCSDLDVYPVNGADYPTAGMYISGVLNSWTPGAGYCSTMNFPTTMRIKPNITFFRTRLSTQGANSYGPGNGVGTTKDGSWDAYDPALGWGSAYSTVLQSLTQTQFMALMISYVHAAGSGGSPGTYLNWSAGSRLFYGAWTADAEL